MELYEPSSARIEQREKSLALVGDFDIFSWSEVEKRITAHAASSEFVSIDLTQCTYVDSTILTVLVRAAKAYGDRLEIVAPPGGNVARVLAVTKLDRYLPIV